MACVGVVRVWLNEKDTPFRYRLFCDEKKCDDPRQQCKVRSSTDSHGGKREWCGCDDREPADCHIVLKTIGKGEGGAARAGKREVLCAGGCKEEGANCHPVVTRDVKVALADGSGAFFAEGKAVKFGRVVDVKCECL